MGLAMKSSPIIIRSKGEYLGSVEAPDRERAKAVAIKQFELDDDQRARSWSGSGSERRGRELARSTCRQLKLGLRTH